MTKEQIETKCQDYSKSATPSFVNGTFDRYAIAQAYEDGAKWRIESVWHDADEEIKNNEPFLYENVVHAFHVDLISLYRDYDDNPLPWNEIVKDLGLIRWAYMADLLPMED